MIRLAPLIAALVFLSQEGFPTRTISVTPEPAPVGVEEVATDLKPTEWYVLSYDEPKSILASPEGIVSVTEYAGPMAFRGRFPGGTQVETRVFNSPHLYSIEAVSKGAVEILVLPKGTEVIRQVVTVEDGTKPNPPPDPEPDPTPTAKHLRLSIVEDSQNRSPDTAILLNALAGWNGLHDSGHEYRLYDIATKEPSGIEAIGKLNGLAPAIIVQNKDTGAVVYKGALPVTFADLQALVGRLTGG